MKPCPERHSPEVFEAAFKDFWPSIWKHYGVSLSPEVEQEWKDSAHRVLNKNYNEDGYQLAKDFEGDDWDVDADFVELMDNWGMALYHAHKNAKAAWVIAEGITPKLKAGLRVKVECRKGKFDRSDIRDGEIVDTMMTRGEYSVFVESLGHVRPHGRQCGVTGLMVPFADLEALNPMTAALVDLGVPLTTVAQPPVADPDVKNRFVQVKVSSEGEDDQVDRPKDWKTEGLKELAIPLDIVDDRKPEATHGQ